jgi:hypothetical protein
MSVCQGPVIPTRHPSFPPGTRHSHPAPVIPGYDRESRAAWIPDRVGDDEGLVGDDEGLVGDDGGLVGDDEKRLDCPAAQWAFWACKGNISVMGLAGDGTKP